MSRWSLLAVALVPALLLLAQVGGEPRAQEEPEVVEVRLRGSPDAGVPADDAAAELDGGSSDGGGPPPTTTELESRVVDQEAELERLRAELEELRDRNDALGEVTDELGGLREQVSGIETQIDQFGTAAEERVATNEERVQDTTRSVDALRNASRQLGYGQVEGVEEEIEYAVSTLTGSARDTAAFALELVRREDYFNARTHLNFALEYAVRSQVVGTPEGAQPPP